MMEYLNLAILAAKNAGKILLEHFGKNEKVFHKGEIDLVTDTDYLSEKEIVALIHKKFPSHNILAEEGGGKESVSEYKWIIDPLDGTTNFAHGYPCFCVSIALEWRNEIVLGVIYDPLLDELFVSQKGKGLFLNEKLMKVSKTMSLSDSLLATGFPYDVRSSEVNNFDHFHNFMLKAQNIRRGGSAALDLAYVASGRLDGFWELKLKPWDMAAGSLMVEEALGKVTDPKDDRFSIYNSDIVATNGHIHQEMLKVLSEGRF